MVIQEELILPVLLRANTGRVDSPYTPYVLCTEKYTWLEGNIERVDFHF